MSVGEKKINTFTIVRFGVGKIKEYQFEEGMTWEEWVNSDYNDGMIRVSGQGVFYTDTPLMSDKGVLSTDIIFNTTYYITSSGGSGGT